MDNFDDFEKKNYEEAKKVTYSSSDLVKFLLSFLWIQVQVYAVLIFEVFLQIKELVSPAKPKDISGQIALVTGLF